jgi:predicted ATPase/class 3 adenylate cyclase
VSLPVGTVTFLRTDIERSMELVRALGPRYDEANAEHASIVRAAIMAHAGEVVRTEGDAFFAVFADAGAAARAAIDIQRAMASHAWPEDHALRLRMGLHSGAAIRAGDDYGGFEVGRAARVAAVGHGGQVVVSESARALVGLDMPADASLRDLGSHRLTGVPGPVRLFQLEAPGLERDFPPLRTGRDPAEHLPERMTTLVGREVELDELGALLSSTRLLTLTGPGGTGKTTLALELARLHASEYLDGAWFVDLQAVTDAEAARAQLARDLGVFDGPTGPAIERLLPYLADRSLLVVVDNLEQVRAASELIDAVVRASSASRLIVTSRIPLRLRAEQEYAVRPLALDGVDGSADEPAAVRLFLERARKYRPDLRLSEDDRRATERVCRLVDGLPLAIELCAARTTVLPITRIAERLAGRLPLPGQGPRDLPARQQTIEDTVAWSFELLHPPLQRLLIGLSIFDGPFELEQAEWVCGAVAGGPADVLEGLVSLVEQSLLVRQDDAVGGVRFRMLETIRAFARTRLDASGEAAALRERHARAYLPLLERLFPKHADTADARVWLDRLEADSDNVRQAVNWSIEVGDVELALGLVGYLWRYWVHSGRLTEGRELARAAMALPGADAPSEARVWALSAVGSLAYWSNDIEQAGARYDEQLALARSLGIAMAEADAWYNLLFIKGSVRGDVAGAQEAAANATRILTELGEERMIEELLATVTLLRAPMVLAAPEEELPWLVEAIAELERSGRRADQNVLPDLRAVRAVVSGDIDAAARELAASARLALTWRRHGDLIAGLGLVATLGVGLMDPEIPATIIGALETAGERYGIVGPPWPEFLSRASPEERLVELEAQLGADGLEQAIHRGRHMTLDEAVTYFEERATEGIVSARQDGPLGGLQPPEVGV